MSRASLVHSGAVRPYEVDKYQLSACTVLSLNCRHMLRSEFLLGTRSITVHCGGEERRIRTPNTERGDYDQLPPYIRVRLSIPDQEYLSRLSIIMSAVEIEDVEVEVCCLFLVIGIFDM